MDPTRSNQQPSTSSSSSSSSSSDKVSTYMVKCTSSDEPAFVAQVSWPAATGRPRSGSSSSSSSNSQQAGKIRQFPPKFKSRPVDKTAIVMDKLPGIELAQYIGGVEASVKPARVEWADELEPSQVCLFLSDDSRAQNRHGQYLDIAGHRLRARPLTEPPLVRVLVTNALPFIDNETIAWHLSRYHGIEVKDWVHLEAVPSPNPATQPAHNVLSFARYLYVEPRDIPKFPAKIQGKASDKSYTIYFGSDEHWCDFCHRVGHYEWSCAKQQMARSIGLNQKPTTPVVSVTAPAENNVTASRPSTPSPRKSLGVYFDDTNQTTTTTSVAAPAEINHTARLMDPPSTPQKQENILSAFGLRIVVSPPDKKSPTKVKSVQVIPVSPKLSSPTSSLLSLTTPPRESNSSLLSAPASPVVDLDGAAAAAAASSAEAAAASAAAATAAAASAAASAAAAAADTTSPSAPMEQLTRNVPPSPRKNSSASTSSNPSCTSSLKKKIRRQRYKNKKNKNTSVAPSSSHLYTKAGEKKKTAAVQAGPSATSTSTQTASSPSKAADASVAAGNPSIPRTDTSNDSSTNPQIVGAIELHPPPATEGPITIEESTARHELPVQLVQPEETNGDSPRSSHPSPVRSDGPRQQLRAAAAPNSGDGNSPSPSGNSPVAEPNNDRPSSGNKKGKRSCLQAAFQHLI